MAIPGQITTKLDIQNITDSKNAVAAYATAAEAAFDSLQKAITALCTDPNFVGDAATALLETFNSLKKGISTDIYGESDSITAMLKNLLDTVDQMRNQVDPQNAQTTSNAISQNAAANGAAAANTNGGN